jgi:hypothetical protein
MMNQNEEEEAWLELERKLKNLDALVKDAEKVILKDPPVAWRKKVGNTWHYFDASTPFNTDDLEPLFLRSEK